MSQLKMGPVGQALELELELESVPLWLLQNTPELRLIESSGVCSPAEVSLETEMDRAGLERIFPCLGGCPPEGELERDSMAPSRLEL